MRHLVSAAISIYLGLATFALAQDRLVVVELFTSQGCSSCPPADGLLSEIASRSDVLGLALHVDYWDYIGWKDEFANPEYTARQKAYARNNGKMSVYTPQMVVGGQDFLVGYKPMQLADLIQQHKASRPEADLDLDWSGEVLEIEVSRLSPTRPVMVSVVTYDAKRTVDIARGENAGRTLEYSNVVTSWTPLGDWDGSGSFRVNVRIETDHTVAVIVQETGPGAIVTAARAN